MRDTKALIDDSAVHPQWRQILTQALAELHPNYVETLLQDDSWLPGRQQLLAAFRRDLSGLRYVLIGESPYPRRDSANGIAFYDAAVTDLWSPQGLSKPVNRATSLRNLLKAMLLAENCLQADKDEKITQAAIAAIDKRNLIQTLAELFDNFKRAGFLMLNATPVLHPERKPAQEAGYWEHFLERLLTLIATSVAQPVTLLLWGKIANRVVKMPASSSYQHLVCEHPYNISFINNLEINRLFNDIKALQKHLS